MDVKPIDISARLDPEYRAAFDALPLEPRDWTDIGRCGRRQPPARKKSNGAKRAGRQRTGS